MRIRFHKTSRERHRLQIERDDGSVVTKDLETRSCLRHDLVHFAFERRARLADSFYGRLARGGDPTEGPMAPADMTGSGDELHATEIMVGICQGAAAREVDPAVVVARAGEALVLQGHAVPPFLTPEFVDGVVREYRKLAAQWESLRLGGVLELTDPFGR